MVFARAAPEQDRVLIGRNVRWLEGYADYRGADEGRLDLSRPAAAATTPIPIRPVGAATRPSASASRPADRTWRLAREYWEKCQNVDGSWGYTIQIAFRHRQHDLRRHHLAGDRRRHGASQRRPGDGRPHRLLPAAHRNAATTMPTASSGPSAGWGKTTPSAIIPGSHVNLLYYLYGLERAGRLTARRFLPLPVRPGQPDRGRLVPRGGRAAGPQSGQPVGLLDGHRIRRDQSADRHQLRPVVSLQRPLAGAAGQARTWPRRRLEPSPHDVANLTRYVESRWKRDLTWQVIDLQLASVEELLQTPVLYLCGSQSPLPDEPGQRKELARKLRDYLDRGGFLLAEAYCGGARLRRRLSRVDAGRVSRAGVQAAAAWSRNIRSGMPKRRSTRSSCGRVWGVEFGCRTSVIYVPPDPPQEPRPSLSCLWELSRPGRGEKHQPRGPGPNRRRPVAGLNVLAYATNRELKTKEDFFHHGQHAAAGRPGRARPAVRGHAAAPRRLQRRAAGAGEPHGVRRPRAEESARHVREELLDITDPALFDYHLVFMHGRTAFRLTDAERQRLKQYVERGGMLMADSICASRAFTESFRREMAAIFPTPQIGANSGRAIRLLGTTYGGFDLRTVSRRDPEATGRAAARWKPRSARSRPTWRASSSAITGAWSSRPTT